MVRKKKKIGSWGHEPKGQSPFTAPSSPFTAPASPFTAPTSPFTAPATTFIAFAIPFNCSAVLLLKKRCFANPFVKLRASYST